MTDLWWIFQWRAFQKTKKMLISNDHRHPKNVNGNFGITRDCINLWSPLAALPSISKNTILTTDSVVIIVFFETLATEKSATGGGILFVDIKLKVPLQYKILSLKHNSYFNINKRLSATRWATL